MLLASSDKTNGNGLADDAEREREHEEIEDTLARHENELNQLRRKVRAIDLELRLYTSKPTDKPEGG